MNKCTSIFSFFLCKPLLLKLYFILLTPKCSFPLSQVSRVYTGVRWSLLATVLVLLSSDQLT